MDRVRFIRDEWVKHWCVNEIWSFDLWGKVSSRGNIEAAAGSCGTLALRCFSALYKCSERRKRD